MQLSGEEHVPPPLFRVPLSLYFILSDVYTSLQAPFEFVKPLHFAKKIKTLVSSGNVFFSDWLLWNIKKKHYLVEPGIISLFQLIAHVYPT
jgi:hypothetical protein